MVVLCHWYSVVPICNAPLCCETIDEHAESTKTCFPQKPKLFCASHRVRPSWTHNVKSTFFPFKQTKPTQIFSLRKQKQVLCVVPSMLPKSVLATWPAHCVGDANAFKL